MSKMCGDNNYRLIQTYIILMYNVHTGRYLNRYYLPSLLGKNKTQMKQINFMNIRNIFLNY